MLSMSFLVSAAVLSAGVTDAGQFKSADSVYSLTSALERSGLDAIAAPVPDEQEIFVAALYSPGRTLLVVSGRHPSPERVADRIAQGRYREAYLELLGTPIPQGKFYIQDANADGILSALPRSGCVDILREANVRVTLFNGDADSQGLTLDEYDARLARTDARYARLLGVLAAAVEDRSR